ncbi:MAG: hypothetical protein ISS45_05365 [Candidatus Omnitrophica bacterium]|nr:hypothetical protein [Candidatus Omnitrophota bacterium]
MSNVEDIAFKLRTELTESARRNTGSGLLFSGGLDSAILASIGSCVKAITVTLRSYGEDLKYATSLAKLLNIEHYQRSVEVDEAIDAIPEVIRILRTFDPAIPNDLVVYFGLKKAHELGIKEVMTGDGSDELFAGYSFMQKLDDLEGYIKRMSRKMRFSSNKIGEFWKIKIAQPFLDRKFIDFSLKIKPELKIKKQEGTLWGKWILRKSFEDILPKKIIWQSKRPLEYGSGMSRLRDIISSRITDAEFKENLYSVKFMNKEHLYYYKIYIKEIGEVPKPKKGEKPCPGCGAGMGINAFHCKVCGNMLNWRCR